MAIAVSKSSTYNHTKAIREFTAEKQNQSLISVEAKISKINKNPT